MFQPSLDRNNARSHMALNIPLRKANIGQQALSFLGPKIRAKIIHVTKNIKTTASFIHILGARNFKQT